MRQAKITVPSLLIISAVVLALSGLVQAGLPEGLVAYYKLDATSGLTAVDELGGHDGTLTGDLTWVEGVDGNGLEFRGGNGSPFVDLGAWQTDGPAGLGLAVWAQWAGTNSFYQGLISQREGTMYWWTEANPEGTQLRFKSNTSPQSNLTVTGEHLIEGEWTHFACTHDAAAGTGAVYLNGEERLAGDWSLPAGDFSNLRIGIGVVNTGDGLGTFNGVLDDVMIFNRPLSEADIAGAMQGYSDPTASAPAPASGSVDVPRDTVLAWQASETAVAHDVYFGTSFDDVSAADRANPLGVLVSEGQDATTYDPDGLLDFGQTYYWRVDEVNGAPDYTIFPGAVWSFTAEPFAYPITGVVATSNGASDADVGPGKTVDGSGLNADDQHSTDATDMWLAVPGAEPLQIQYEFDGLYKLHEMLVWNYNVQFELMLGFGLKDVTVEYSENGTDWTLLGDTELAQATAKSDYAANTTVAFEGVAARYVRLTVNSGYGSMGQFGLSEVRFTFIPATAREPQPADGQTALLVDATLGWRAGRSAVTHNVYLGTAPEALALTDAVSEASYVPGNLEYGHTYYWRIDEVNEADAVSVWEGDLWSFATEEYAVIDDMERYDDEENLIFDTWIDGFINDTGSTVGYFEAPFAEQTIVNGGGQSMPLEYDNSAAPFYSEAELDLGSANWTTYGADTLRLFVSGQAPAFFETADGSILVNAIGTDIWGTADEFRYAYKSLTGDGSMTARVEALDGTPSTWAKAGVMVRQSTDGGSRHSMMILTGGDGNGASWQGRLVDNAGSENTNMTDPVAPPYWVRIDRVGDSLSGFISADGQTWTQVGAARTIAMDDPVLIGLAVTSHNANQATSAEFSNIATTGNVMGNWQMAEVGVAQPEGNIPDTLYVAIEDTSGNMAVVTHPDANITARSGWTEWLVPHSDLAGVNLSRVAILIIGVGDRDNPTAGGAGLIYVDDIGVGHPATVE